MRDFALLTGNYDDIAAAKEVFQKLYHSKTDLQISCSLQSQKTTNHLTIELSQGSLNQVEATSVYEQIVTVGTYRVDNTSASLKNLVTEDCHYGNHFAEKQRISSAYIKWGRNMARFLGGDFCFSVYDPGEEVLHGALSPFNGSMLFLFQHQSLVGVTSNTSFIKALPGITFTPNRSSLSSWLAGQPDPHSSMFNEIKAIPPGYSFTFCEGQLKLEKFWDIDPQQRIRLGGIENYKQHFLSLLNSSVDKYVGPDSSLIFSQMSGGMDSTSVSYLASKICEQKSIPFHTLSHRYPENANCDESDLIDILNKQLKPAGSHFMDIDRFEDLAFSQLYPTDFNNPGIVDNPQYNQELEIISALGGTTLLTGNGGDEVCWGHALTYTSRLIHGDLKVVPEVVRTCHDLHEPVSKTIYRLFFKPFLPDFLLQTANLLRGKQMNPSWPQWLKPAAVEMASESLYNNPFFSNPYSKRLNPAKFARYQSLHRTSTYNSLRSYQKAANRFGIQVCHPFFDPRIVQFSFAIPEKLLINGKYPKWLLRSTMDGLLPDEICWKQNKVVFDQHFANLARNNAKELTALLSHEGLHEIGLIDNAVVLNAFNDVLNTPNKNLNVDLLYVILTQSWYQQHCI